MSSGSWASSEGVQRSMRSNRGRDTSPEMAVRRAVWARGMRYRVDTRPLPELNRRADLVFRQERVAVFVDGCYWHSCPIHATRPSTNSVFWALKLENTIARDLDTNQQLRAHGWDVLRFWEHEDVEAVADAVEQAVRGRIP
ncbi:very short patch repair endonuclease [Candidatus Neomicrothrix sp.]|uniref:very short patch repair endonuclease n=1 Tax=Candidatus Neomicrothrix sp. TaxID=2719034 RepID=UPI002592B8AC|nr:very short patch repair endonuclease [Candidatus Microthrix sp.]HMS47716.1 very short patch repair endonuclease [Candidatus Microthrix sp.]